MKIYLAIGLICLLSINVFSRVARRDDNGVPASIIQDANGNFVIITADGWMKVVSSTTLTGGFIDQILNPVTTYMTISQVVDLKIVTLPDGTTVYINESQVADLKVVTLPDGTTVYLTESQLESLKRETTAYITNFPTDYPDTTSQSSLSSIDTNLKQCDTKDVVITSGVVKEFQVSNATGTVLSVGTGAVTTYTFPAGAVEIILEADKTNTDITRWRYWNEEVKTAGNKLHPGDVWILNKWSGTTIYFQTEAGTQDIITQVLYE